MKKIFLPMIALILLLVACSEDNADSQEPEERITPVEVGEVTKDDLVIEKKFYGRAMPDATSPVIPPIAGEIDTLEVSKGDKVEEEDVLATLTRADGRGTMDLEASADGEITTLNAKEGSMVSNSEPFAIITNLDEMQIQVDITANNQELFRAEDEVPVQFSGLDLETTAVVDYVSPVANETGLYTVELSVENEDHTIKSGMVSVLNMPERVVEDTLLVPTAALIEQADQTFVYIIEDDKAVQKEVTVVESQTDLTAIEAEIKEGDTIVTNGQLTLTDGNQVRIMKEER